MRLQTTVWRAHNPRWAFAPTSGTGAARHGGRFNRVGLAALYTSMRFETAWLEAQQAFPFKAQPMTICGYNVDCEDIADLCEPAAREALGIAYADLACPWEYLADSGQEPPSWAMSDACITRGLAGAVVPSFASGATAADRNVVFWSWADAPPRKVKVIDDTGRLPRNDASWR